MKKALTSETLIFGRFLEASETVVEASLNVLHGPLEFAPNNLITNFDFCVKFQEIETIFELIFPLLCKGRLP